MLGRSDSEGAWQQPGERLTMLYSRRYVSALLLCFCCLSGLPSFAQTPPPPAPIKVALVPVAVEGKYQPLTAEEVNSLLLETVRAEAPDVNFVVVQRDPSSWTPETALAEAEKENVVLITWGRVSFDRASENIRKPFRFGQLKLLITVNADIQIGWVPGNKRILTSPTIVTTPGDSNAMTEGGDPETEKKLARAGVVEVAKSLVEIVRQRKEAGWFVK